MTLLISACLLGTACRYDGKSVPLPQETIDLLREKFTLVPLCAEILGGLPTPRIPSERVGDRVVARDGKDVTDAFHRGASEVVRLAKITGCTAALLKERSPSCGSGTIYDGTFRGTLRNGDGVTAEALKKEGIPVFGESQIEDLLRFRT